MRSSPVFSPLPLESSTGQPPPPSSEEPPTRRKSKSSSFYIGFMSVSFVFAAVSLALGLVLPR